MKLNLKNLALGIAASATTALLLPSCSHTANDDRKTMYSSDSKADPKEVAEKNNEAMIKDRKAEKDAQFLVDAASINLEEIELGQLAQTKSTDAEVKRVSQMMVNSHSKSFNELKALASRKGVFIPTTLTEDGQEAYDKLSEKKLKDFNQDYCDKMVSVHKRAINKFEEAAKDAQDDEIRDWAAATLPRLRVHLEQADLCHDMQQDIKKVHAGIK